MNYLDSQNELDRLKIILVYPGYPPEEQTGGGISTFAQEAAQGLIEAGHKVVVISRSIKNSIESEIENKNLKIYRVPEETKLSKKFKVLTFRKAGAFLYSRRVQQLIKNIEEKDGPVDVIECGDWGAEAINLVKLYKDRLLIRCHTPSFISEKYNPSNKPYLSKFIKFLEKHTLKNVSYLASPSISLMLEIKKQLKIRGKVTIQPYPLKIDSAPYKKEYLHRFSTERPFKILVAGRLEERKGQDIVCRAINLLVQKKYPIKIFFAGADTLLGDEKTFQSKLLNILNAHAQKKVYFLGHVSRNAFLRMYPEFDCYIMSSRFESLGFVVLEAMRAGLPVIASNMCEMPRLIQEGLNGNLFELNDFRELASKIENLIQNPNKAEMMGKSARNYIKEYINKEQPIQQMISLYYQLIKINNFYRNN
jgi:glycosyltransferase involved in cell wall biosynthesis